jgi:dicarboxylate transporter 10
MALTDGADTRLPFLSIKAMSGASTTSSLELLAATVRVEGPRALFRGWVPAYLRLGPHALICLPVFEQMRAFVGMEYL